MSNSAAAPNRFCDIENFIARVREITRHNIIQTLQGAELLSQNKDIIASIVAPATGTTIAKIANAINDTPVCLAVKALLRNEIPCVIGVSSNDCLSGNAENIGKLLNRKNIYFVPFAQDNPTEKPFSCVCDFALIEKTLDGALNGKQIQPIIYH
jgi:dipicolinate synthase subunit B